MGVQEPQNARRRKQVAGMVGREYTEEGGKAINEPHATGMRMIAIFEPRRPQPVYRKMRM
jgi:hypothetical protein